MDVTGAALNRVGKNDVHQFDDGRLFRLLLQLVKAQVLLIGGQFYVGVHFVHRGHYLFQIFLTRDAVGLLNAIHDGGFRGHHRLDVKAGHELDIVHGEYVGRINHGNGQ